MAQGEFTKEEARETVKAVDELFKALPKTKARGYIGHLNDIFLFLHAAEKAAPENIETLQNSKELVFLEGLLSVLSFNRDDETCLDEARDRIDARIVHLRTKA